jgi:cell shape-determining protein MreC
MSRMQFSLFVLLRVLLFTSSFPGFQLRPLHEQMKSLKSELELMQSLRAEIEQLKTQVAEIGTLKEKVEALTGELQDLRMQATPTTPLASEHLLSKYGTLAPPWPAAPSSPSGHFSQKEPR